MRIEGTPGQQLPTAYVWLARSEAAELRDALNDMLERAEDPSRHTHISAADFAAAITLAWEIESDTTSTPDRPLTLETMRCRRHESARLTAGLR